MSLRIRDFAPADYPALCSIGKAVEPDSPTTVDELRFEDVHQDPKCHWQRWVAEWAGEVVGSGGYSQPSGMYHPRKFVVSLSVYPDFQGRGIGSELYDTLMRALAPFDPLLIRTYAREDSPRSPRFLADRGFQEEMREWESRLDPRLFDPALFRKAEERVRAQGIEIRTLRELEADPDRNRKVHALDSELERDVPGPDPPTPVPYEVWLEASLGSPNLLPDGWFVAVHGQEYVGYSNLWSSKASDVLHTGLTGVRRDYRRRGIALALKVRAIRYAQERGAPEIRTWNETGNEAMLSINLRLGFVKQPAWIAFAKVLRAES
jgi:GNAT superfamily N-acetyltransferase